jgi:transcriptional regulator CtsR
MKKVIKLILASILLLCSSGVFAEGVDIVTLTTTAEGTTKNEAVNNALRSAVEQAFGTFISSNTNIVNDELIKDEIVSVSNGNINKYDVLSSTVLPNGNTFAMVKADVSIAKLTKFCESKGVEVEFKGALFAANIKLQQLYAKNEPNVISNLATIVDEIISNQICYDYEIKVSEPEYIREEYRGKREREWLLKYNITITPNQNLNNLLSIIKNTLGPVSLNKEEQKDYKEKNLDFYKFSFLKGYSFRNETSIGILHKICDKISHIKFQCQIKNGLYTKYLYPGYRSDNEFVVGLLTNYVPMFRYKIFEQVGFCSEYFELYFDSERHYNPYSYYKQKEIEEISKISGYESYNFPSSLYTLRVVKQYHYSANYLLDEAYVSYSEAFPLSVLEKIEKYTIEPLTLEDIADNLIKHDYEFKK